ncbi:MAG: hypothetical protein FWE07_06775 [Turicibacter sp.]|nr:hypothetical protein [Turicibacter sp.]
MKKMRYRGLSALLLFLVACNGSVGEGADTSHDSIETPTSANPPEVVVDLDEQAEVELSSLTRIGRNNRADGVVLLDRLTDEALNEVVFSFDEDQLITEIFEFSNGYFGALVLSGLQVDRGEEGDIFGMSWSAGADVSASFLLLDAEFYLLQELEITAPEVAHVWFPTAVFEDGEVLIYYQISVWGSIEPGLYAYNATTNTRERVDIELDEELSFRLYTTGTPHQFAFLATRLDDEIHTYYGVLDIETGEVQDERTTLPIGILIINGNYFLLTENPVPALMGGVPDSQVIVFDMRTGASHTVQLEGYESLWAMVVADRYVLTTSDDDLHMRLYDIQTSELVLDQAPAVALLPREDGLVEDGRYLGGSIHPHVRDFIPMGAGIYAVVFDIGDGTLHTEFITID